MARDVQISRLFGHLYLWKESSDILDFLDGDGHPGKLVSETHEFGWRWPSVCLVHSNLWIRLSSRYLQGIN